MMLSIAASAAMTELKPTIQDLFYDLFLLLFNSRDVNGNLLYQGLFLQFRGDNLTYILLASGFKNNEYSA